ncbi:MAG: hypothetical protein QOJ57_1353 [Thermoleophilaceae bacterium]|nr:hypothetical protein [Thermoleophilaceae bacterium]
MQQAWVSHRRVVVAGYTSPKPVKRCPLHAASVGATLAVLAVALSAEPAGAHVNVEPRLLQRGEITDVVVELPRLRPGAPPRRLVVEGPGIEVLSSGLLALKGSESRWNVRLRADAPPGTVAIVLRAVYADGRAVEVRNALTVVPREEPSSFPWAGAVGGFLLAIATAAAALAIARRRR